MGASLNAATRIYLDHAATGWPKPPEVYAAVEQAMRENGAAAGRGGYRHAVEAADIVAQTRSAIARMIGASSAHQIVLAANGTAALNLALQGCLSATTSTPAHVVTTAAEHNSVLRPLQALADRQQIELEIVACDATGTVDAAAVLAAVRETTRLVAVGHASNVTAALQPIAHIGAALSDHAALFLVDAAQTFGYLPIDVVALQIDLLATPGHKGGCGPLGTGALFISHRADPQILPSVWGGTGGNSDHLTMPAPLPDRLEAGNLNVPAIAGWLAGLQWLEAHPQQSSHVQTLSGQLDQRLGDLAGCRVLGIGQPLPLRSLVFEGLAAADAGAILDAEFDLQVRTGLHCAALIHRSLDTLPDGTVRISAGHPTSPAQIDAACDAIVAVATEMQTLRNG